MLIFKVNNTKITIDKQHLKIMEAFNEKEIIEASDEKEIIYTFNYTEEGAFRFPFDIDISSVNYFIDLLKNKHTIKEDDILNFLEVKLCCDYFNTSKVITDRLDTQLHMKFTSPLTIFTAYRITKEINTQIENIDPFLNLTQFPLIDKLKFLIAHNHADTWSPQSQEINISTLNIPVTLNSILNKDECVIAGGAAMYLGCPWSKWTLRCDVDFFVLDTPKAIHIMEQVVTILLDNKYKVCQSSKSVLTAIGFYGMQRIQIIRSSAKNVDELISSAEGFDLNTIKAYYDGQRLYKTFAAELDWLTKECSGCTFTSVKPLRLLGIWWKGFKLNALAQKYLENTIGWPVEQEIIDEYESNVPCLTPGIPDNIQEYQLKRMNLPIIKDLNIVSEMPPLFNHYGPTGTFTQSYEEYVQTLKVDFEAKKIKYYNEHTGERNNYPGEFINIDSSYLLRIPVSIFPFGYDFQRTDGRGEIQRNQRLMLSKDEYKSFRDMERDILKLYGEELLPLRNYVHYVSENEQYVMPDICVRIDDHTSFFINGIQTEGEIVINKQTKVSLVAYPVYIHNHYQGKEIPLRSKYPKMSDEDYYSCHKLYSRVIWSVVSVYCSQETILKKKKKIIEPVVELESLKISPIVLPNMVFLHDMR